MVDLRRLLWKHVVVFLIISILQGHVGLFSSSRGNELYLTAREYYNHGLYKASVSILQEVLDLEPGITIDFRARILLLLGYGYAQLGEEENARAFFRQVRAMLDKELIPALPQIPGVDNNAFPHYQRILGGVGFFRYRSPISVASMIEDNVVHVPKKRVIKQRKKKHFPWVVVAGFTALVAAVLLTKQDKGKETFDEVDWVQIPPGIFTMGDIHGEGEPDEIPAHDVYLDSYYISKFEISIKQYNYYCRETKRIGVSYPNIDSEDISTKTERYPAAGVSWMDAKGFCDWLSQRLGRKVFLPTEAQWEKAARGGTQYRYPWGDNDPDCVLANYIGCSNKGNEPGQIKHTGFSTSGVSTYGLFEMAGNVAEWCRDFYDPHYYRNSPKENPHGPLSGTHHVVRGGSCFDSPFFLRCSARTYYDSNYTHSGIGFRVVLEL